MEEKKLSTADILARIRAQKAGAASAAETPAAEPAPAAPVEATPPAAATPAAAPGSTSDILAKVRAQKAAAAAAPAAASAPAAPAASAAAPAAKPGSTSDILAKIRAQKAGGTAPAAEAPAAAATAAAPAATKPAAPTGPLPSVAEMVRAARQGAPAAAETKPAVVAPPPMPAKPVPAAGKRAAPAPARRSLSTIVMVAAVSAMSFVLGVAAGSPLLIAFGVFVWGLLMTPFAAAWASVSAVTGIATLGTARFMFPNVLVEPPSKFKVGPASDYPLNTVSNKWKDQFGIWIVHTDQYEGKNLIYALSTVCTHLGCTPNWLDGEQKFKCPCHGSGFYMTGVNFEGPAPRPLERMGLRIAEDGMLEVDKSLKFQEEMGQWTDASSYVEVA